MKERRCAEDHPTIGDPEFDEIVYRYLNMPRPSRTVDTFDEYDFMWWSTFGYIFRDPRALILRFEALDDPRAKRFMEFARHVAAANPPADRSLRCYYNTFAMWPCESLREVLNIKSPITSLLIVGHEGGYPPNFFSFWRQSS